MPHLMIILLIPMKNVRVANEYLSKKNNYDNVAVNDDNIEKIIMKI